MSHDLETPLINDDNELPRRAVSDDSPRRAVSVQFIEGHDTPRRAASVQFKSESTFRRSASLGSNRSGADEDTRHRAFTALGNTATSPFNSLDKSDVIRKRCHSMGEVQSIRLSRRHSFNERDSEEQWSNSYARSALASLKEFANKRLNKNRRALPPQVVPSNVSHGYLITDSQKKEMRSLSHRMVFQQNSYTIQCWDTLMFFALLAVGVIEPCVFVFRFTGLESTIYYWLTIALFSADIILRCFRVQRKSTRDGVVFVTHVPEITKMYMRDWMFLVDVISAFPLTAVCVNLGLTSADTGHFLSGFRMIRFLKFARLPDLLHRIHDVTGWSFSRLSVFQFGCISCLVLHWIACLWCYLGSMNHSWLDNVRGQYDFLNYDDKTDLYLMSLYWAITVLSSVGFGDITPRAKIEFFCAIISMAIGGTVWAYVVGSICGMAATADKHRTAFESQVNDVNVMCAEREIPYQLSERIRDFFQHAKQFMRMQLYHETIRQLSPQLKGEVVSWMYGKCFKRVWYFDVLDERGARLLSEGMVPKMYAPEELIEDTIDGMRCLVFLRSGLCVRKCNLLAPGAVWGLDVILGSEEHDDIEHLMDLELARSINFAFVLKLGKVHIDHAANLTPSFARRLRKAHLRMLFWRGVIAANRANTRLEKRNTEQSLMTHPTPTWDKLGKKMAQVVHIDRLLLDKAEDPRAPDASNQQRRHSSAHIHMSKRRASKAPLLMGHTGSAMVSRRPSLSAMSDPRDTRRTSKEAQSNDLVKRRGVQVRDQSVQVDRRETDPGFERKPQKKTRDQGTQVELLTLSTTGVVQGVMSPTIGTSKDNAEEHSSDSEATVHQDDVSTSICYSPVDEGVYDPRTSQWRTYGRSRQTKVGGVPRKPVASIKVKPGAMEASLKPGLAATWAQHKAKQEIEPPHLAKKLRHVYNNMQGNGVAGQNPEILRQFSAPLPFKTLQPAWNSDSNTSGPSSSPLISPVSHKCTSWQQDDRMTLAGLDATAKAPYNNSESETFVAEVSTTTETRRQTSSDSADKKRRSLRRQISSDSEGHPAAMHESTSPIDGSPSASDLERDSATRKRKTTSWRNQNMVDDMENDTDSPSGLLPRRRVYTTRFRSDSGLESLDSPRSEMTWRNEMENKLEDLGEDLACINEGIEDDFNILKDDVSELTRMMHQLLTRFDAEEKY